MARVIRVKILGVEATGGEYSTDDFKAILKQMLNDPNCTPLAFVFDYEPHGLSVALSNKLGVPPSPTLIHTLAGIIRPWYKK